MVEGIEEVQEAGGDALFICGQSDCTFKMGEWGRTVEIDGTLNDLVTKDISVCEILCDNRSLSDILATVCTLKGEAVDS